MPDPNTLESTHAKMREMEERLRHIERIVENHLIPATEINSDAICDLRQQVGR